MGSEKSLIFSNIPNLSLLSKYTAHVNRDEQGFDRYLAAQGWFDHIHWLYTGNACWCWLTYYRECLLWIQETYCTVLATDNSMYKLQYPAALVVLTVLKHFVGTTKQLVIRITDNCLFTQQILTLVNKLICFELKLFVWNWNCFAKEVRTLNQAVVVWAMSPPIEHPYNHSIQAINSHNMQVHMNISSPLATAI